MALQLSAAVRNAMLDAFESTIGTSAKYRIYTGAVPANCAAAEVGTLLADVACPSDWMSAASAGQKALLGVWAATVVATNTAAHWRIVDTAGTTCHAQGTCTLSGGGGDVILDSLSFTTGQGFTQNSFTLTAGNA